MDPPINRNITSTKIASKLKSNSNGLIGLML